MAITAFCGAAKAAEVSFVVNPSFEAEYMTGSPSAVGAGRVDVVRGTTGESRGVWEFALPAMAPGFSLNGAAINSFVGNLQGSLSATPADVSFHGYSGNGSFNGSADGLVGFNQVARTGAMTSGGARTDVLSTSYLQQRYAAGSTHLGLMGYAEVTELRAGFNQVGSSGGPTRLSVTATVPDAGTVVARPVVDVKAALTNGSYVLTDGEGVINTQYAPQAPTPVDRRGILEYHLGGVPSGATIQSAKLSFVLNGLTTSGGDGPEVRLYGYSGDGQASTADVNQTANLLGTGSSVTANGPYEVTLNPATIQALLASGNDYLGVVAFGSADSHQFSFLTNEGGSPAQLSVTYAVPEPSAMALLAGGVGLLLGRRRRR